MKLTILSTSDTHGYLLPTDYRTKEQASPLGLVRAQAVIERQRQLAGSDPVIVIDNGDFLQGSPLAYYQAKVARDVRPLTQAYDCIPYQVGIIGNHEFNYGRDYLQTAIQASQRPFACANILDEHGDPALAAPYQLLHCGGITVAVLGLTTQYIPHWEAPNKIKGLHFVSAVKTAAHWVPKLHKLADIVIVAYHGGFERDLKSDEPTEALTGENEGSALLKEVVGIDALVTGHQHRQLAAVVNQIPLTQPGYQAADVGKITLTLDEQGQIQERTAELLDAREQEPKAQMVNALVSANQKVESWLDQPLGRTTGDLTITDPLAVRLKPHPYIQFIQNVQRAVTKAPISGTALFNNQGTGFGKIITFRSILTNYIYPNTLAVERISGADLKAALEQTAGYFTLLENGHIGVSARFYQPKPQHYNYDMYAGIRYTIDVAKPVGQRVVSLTYQNEKVRSEQILEVVINQYRAVGGGNYRMFSAQKIIREVPEDMTELIANYLREHSLVTAEVEPSFRVINSQAQ